MVRYFSWAAGRVSPDRDMIMNTADQSEAEKILSQTSSMFEISQMLCAVAAMAFVFCEISEREKS